MCLKNHLKINFKCLFFVIILFLFFEFAALCFTQFFKNNKITGVFSKSSFHCPCIHALLFNRTCFIVVLLLIIMQLDVCVIQRSFYSSWTHLLPSHEPSRRKPKVRLGGFTSSACTFTLPPTIMFPSRSSEGLGACLGREKVFGSCNDVEGEGPHYKNKQLSLVRNPRFHCTYTTFGWA